MQSRPLFPNHKHKVADIKRALTGREIERYSSDPLEVAKHVGMSYPIVTCKQRDNKYTKQRMYGVELEVSSDLSPNEIYNLADYPFFICKSDSSIASCRRYSTEMVGLPASLKANCVLWSTILNKMIEHAESNLEQIGGTSGSNGIHIHAARDNFIDARHLRNFLTTMNRFEHTLFLYELSDRQSFEQFVRWSQMAWLHEGHRLGTNRNLVKFASQIESTCRYMEKYAMTNLMHRDTVEIRMFQGDVSAANMVKNLQFVDSMIAFTAERSVTTCTIPYYIKWLASTPKNQYTELKECIRLIGTQNILDNFKALSVLTQPNATQKNAGKKILVSGNNQVLRQLFSYYSIGADTLHIEGNVATITFKEAKHTRMFKQHASVVTRYANVQLTSEAA